MATEVKAPTMNMMDVIHNLIDKSGADESLRLDMHDAINEADKERLSGLSEEELTGRTAPVNRLSSGVGGGAAGGLTKADLDKAVAAVKEGESERIKAAVDAALAAHGIGTTKAGQ